MFGELAPVLPREIEEQSEHLRRQLHRHAVDPVECLAPRQAVEHFAGAIPDVFGQPRHFGGGEGGRDGAALVGVLRPGRSAEHTSELTSLMRISYTVFCLTKK